MCTACGDMKSVDGDLDKRESAVNVASFFIVYLFGK